MRLRRRRTITLLMKCHFCGGTGFYIEPDKSATCDTCGDEGCRVRPGTAQAQNAPGEGVPRLRRGQVPYRSLPCARWPGQVPVAPRQVQARREPYRPLPDPVDKWHQGRRE